MLHHVFAEKLSEFARERDGVLVDARLDFGLKLLRHGAYCGQARKAVKGGILSGPPFEQSVRSCTIDVYSPTARLNDHM